jgi:hypothetical protein
MSPSDLALHRLTLRLTALESALAVLASVAIPSDAARQQFSVELSEFEDRAALIRFPDLTPEESDMLAQEAKEIFQGLAAFLNHWAWNPKKIE